jgi:benzoate membrane transport protein
MATVLPFRPRAVSAASSAAAAESRPYRGRIAQSRGRGAVRTRRASLLRDFNQAAAWAGLTTFLWYAVGMVPVQIAVVGQFGLDRAQVSSWMFIIWATGAVSSAILSLVYRQPLATTSSLSALIFLGTLSGRFSFDDIAGANMMAGVLVILLACVGFGRRLLVWLPMPLAMAMLGGSILSDAMTVVSTTVSDVAVAGVTVMGYVFGRALRNPRVPPIGLALIAGGLAVAVMHTANPEPVDWTLPSLAVPGMHFSAATFLAISLPLIVLSIGLGNVQGLGYLAEQGYRVPADRVTLILGVNSVINAIFGGHTAQVSRNGIPIMASPEAGPLQGRYWGSLLVALSMVAIALAAAPVTSLLAILPHSYVITLAGLAILPSFQDAMERAFGGTLRFAALVSFLVAATPFSILGITSAFWALVLGMATAFITDRTQLMMHWRDERSGPARRETRLPVFIHPDSAVCLAGDLRIPIRATVRNISANGLLVHSAHQLLSGSQLELTFHGSDQRAVRLRADVRHVRHLPVEAAELWEAGCEFRETDLDLREQLVRAVLAQHEAPEEYALASAS